MPHADARIRAESATDGDTVGQLLVLRRRTLGNHKVRAITGEEVYGGRFRRVRRGRRRRRRRTMFQRGARGASAFKVAAARSTDTPVAESRDA